IAQQLIDLAPQFFVARAGLREKRIARARLALQRRVIKLLNLLPAFMLHPAFPHAAFSAATTRPIASRGEPSRPKMIQPHHLYSRPGAVGLLRADLALASDCYPQLAQPEEKKLSHGLQFFPTISAWNSEAQRRVCAFENGCRRNRIGRQPPHFNR